MKAKTNSNFVTGALLISLGGLVAKILGALYRIPLTNIIGSYGMGLYQLVFPPYILFLTLCQAGIPTALSKLIAEKNQLNQAEQGKKIFKFCFYLLLFTGLAGCVLLMSFSGIISKAQGNSDTTMAFIIVAPALLFIPVTNVFKGYFQGKMNMLPSSMTTVVESVVKLIVGLICATYFMPDVLKAVYGAVFAITISELVSLLIMSTIYLVDRRKNKTAPVKLQKTDISEIAKQTITIALPVALGAFVMQLSQVIDSIMVVNLLTVDGATSLYGLWTGPVNSMLGLPIALSAGVAVAALPSITKTKVAGDSEKLSGAFNSALKLTLVIAVPCAFGMIMLSRPILSLLYGGLAETEIYTASLLLAISGLSIVFLAIMQTSVAVLQAVGKPYVSVIIIACSIVVKAVVNLFLLPINSINIYGAAISETLCYLFATVCVMIYLTAKQKMKIDVTNTVLKPVASSAVMTLAIVVLVGFAGDFVNTKLGTLTTIVIAGIAYFAMLMMLKTFDSKELALLPSKKKKSANLVAETVLVSEIAQAETVDNAIKTNIVGVVETKND